jgi:hypothetical protein
MISDKIGLLVVLLGNASRNRAPNGRQGRVRCKMLRFTHISGFATYLGWISICGSVTDIREINLIGTPGSNTNRYCLGETSYDLEF